MTSTVMLAAVRTILDESSASFWTDAEAYAALADAQNEVIKEILNVYRTKRRIDSEVNMPYELESLQNDDTGTVGSPAEVAIPTGFLTLLRATWDNDNTGGEKPCYLVEGDKINFRENNTFLTADSNSPKAYIASSSDTLKLIFLPDTVGGTGAYSFWFIKTPTDIASGQNATLPVGTHSAIVNYAVARMFEKDEKVQEASMAYNKYLQELKTILGI